LLGKTPCPPPRPHPPRRNARTCRQHSAPVFVGFRSRLHHAPWWPLACRPAYGGGLIAGVPARSWVAHNRSGSSPLTHTAGSLVRVSRRVVSGPTRQARRRRAGNSSSPARPPVPHSPRHWDSPSRTSVRGRQHPHQLKTSGRPWARVACSHGGHAQRQRPARAGPHAPPAPATRRLQGGSAHPPRL